MAGKREIVFDEIVKISESFGINAVRLLFDKEYPETNLAFRNLKNDIQVFTSKVEDVFLLIENSLPKINAPSFSRNLRSGYRRHDVIQEAGAFVSEFRKRYPTPEVFLTQYQVPVIPVESIEADFDAFIVSHGPKAAICVNTYKRPPHRLIFSLAHEVCHMLFDRNRDIPVDVFLPSLHWNVDISEELLPEFFAYKFAQFFLIPYDESIHLAKKFPELDLAACQNAVDEGRTLKDVLANSIFDTLTSNQEFFYQEARHDDDEEEYQVSGEQFRRMDYEENREPDWIEQIDRDIRRSPVISFRQIKKILENITPSRNAQAVQGFLKESQKTLIQCIRQDTALYSENVLKYIEETLQIELR
ncbi:hypothetical protein Dole_3099 [Desulfosudis oleivorans Hxd3]|uniref:IrrE N-terminal-like domain-containing protein n=1 Tax=Desulfosudis oleivorans (strain DSM 6200 / JCM 39069 / Hxd3) TaxID=96561 RepID=A8ZZN0_DESOH|nr:hypothetical protein Dole_3099 [Desulfosudis oleivorans Hxd3]